MKEKQLDKEEDSEQINQEVNTLLLDSFHNRIDDESEGDPCCDTAGQRHDDDDHERCEGFTEIFPLDLFNILKHQGTDQE